jgi:hypothetical protein
MLLAWLACTARLLLHGTLLAVNSSRQHVGNRVAAAALSTLKLLMLMLTLHVM